MNINWLKNLARLYLPVYQYESDTMRIAYAGYSSIKKNYYVRLVLDGNKKRTFLGRRFYWQITGLIKSNNFDIVVSEISPIVMNHFQKCNGYIVPEWVRMKINIDRPLSEISMRSISDFSDVKRRIRKYHLTYEMLTSKKSFDDFNYNYYLPYITKRHGGEAWIEDMNIKWNTSPQLIAIKENGEIVGEALIRKSGDSLFLMRLGLRDGDEEYRLHGVIGAIYYFSILEGQKLGCRILDVGCTHPFLTDGLTRYKRGLGAEFMSNLSPKRSRLWLGVNEHSIVATEFIRNNPFMHINKDFSLTMSGV